MNTTCLKSFAFAVAVLFASHLQALAHKYILVDSHNRRILDSEFEQLGYTGDGIYSGRKRGSSKVEFINSEGRFLQLATPSDWVVKGICCPGAHPVSGPRLKFPEDAYFIVSKAGLYGLCDSKANLVIPCEYDELAWKGAHRFVLQKGTTIENRKSYLFNCDGNTCVELPPKASVEFCQGSPPLLPFTQYFDHGVGMGYCTGTGKVVVPARYRVCNEFNGARGTIREFEGSPLRYIDAQGRIGSSVSITKFGFRDGISVASPTDSAQPKDGLIDSKFHFVVAPVYDELLPVGEHIYAARSKSSWCAISANGRRLFNFPDNVKWVQPADPGCADDLIVCDMIGKNKYFRLNVVLDQRGKVVIPAEYAISGHKYGLITALKREKNLDMLMGVLDSRGSWLIPPESAYFTIAGPDRLVKEILSTKFDPDEWRGDYHEQERSFQHLLRDYDLIDMPLTQLTSLLGNGEEQGDTLVFWMSHRCLQVQFTEGKVRRWRITSAPDNEREPWISENMIYTQPDDSASPELVPKAPQ